MNDCKLRSLASIDKIFPFREHKEFNLGHLTYNIDGRFIIFIMDIFSFWYCSNCICY
jgi:hypothetical protein